MATQSKIKYITVHCSASKHSSNIGAKEIDQMHKERGFKGIGYHYVIRRDGTLERGRAENIVGAHVEGYNTGNIGICLIGGLDDNLKPENNFTPQQFKALKFLIQGLKAKYLGAKLMGHRDFPNVNKACPCFNVVQWYNS